MGYKRHVIALIIVFGLIPAGFGQVVTPTPSSNSVPSATPAPDDGFRRAVAEALEELRAARKLIEAQGAEIKVKDELIALERQLAEGQKHLNELNESQKAELLKAVAAKDKVIADYEAEIVVLKKQRTSFLRKAELVVFGAAAGLVIGFVLKH